MIDDCRFGLKKEAGLNNAHALSLFSECRGSNFVTGFLALLLLLSFRDSVVDYTASKGS